jgi:hypothetical protein
MLVAPQDRLIEKLKKEKEIATNYSNFLEEAKIDLRAESLLAVDRSYEIKRRRLYCIEQAMEKAAKAAYPLLLNNLKEIKPDTLYKELMQYKPKNISHFPKGLIDTVSKSLLILNKVNKNLGTDAKDAFNKKDLSKLLEYNKLIERELDRFRREELPNLKPNDSAELVYKKFQSLHNSINAYYVLGMSIWKILSDYEQQFRYPYDKKRGDNIPENLLDLGDDLHRYVENFIRNAVQDVQNKKSMSFPDKAPNI